MTRHMMYLMTFIHGLVLLFSLFSFTACKMGVAEIGSPSAASTGDPSLTFSGITSIDGVTDSKVIVHWTAQAEAVSYSVYDVSSGTLVLIKTVSGQSTNFAEVTGLTPGTNYIFLVRMWSSRGLHDLNEETVAQTTNTTPNTPIFALSSPTSSPSNDSTPTFRVSDVGGGSTVRIYSDNTCSTLVTSQVVPVNATSINYTAPALAEGSYTYAVTSTNSIGQVSACSTALTYRYYNCPSNYLRIPGNPDLGTTEFCIAKYEMRDVAGVATPVDSGANIWTDSQYNAGARCEAIDGAASNYDLVTDLQWMTVARNIEAQDANWSSGVAGTGHINRGYAANTLYGDSWTNTDQSLDSNAANLYNIGVDTTGATGSFTYKRTHILSTGEEIWDFSGNVWEWNKSGGVLPWEKPESSASPLPSNASADPGWFEWNVIDTNIGPTDHYNENMWTSMFHSTINYKAAGLGGYLPGFNNDGGRPTRGGRFDHGYNAGIYSLSLKYVHTDWNITAGFRCVYNP